MHKILPSDYIVHLIPDGQVFGRKGKYINDPHILKEVGIIDTCLHENFPHIRIKHKYIHKMHHPLKYLVNIFFKFLFFCWIEE